MALRISILCSLFIFLSRNVYAQSIVVGQHNCDDWYISYNPVLAIPIYTPYYLDVNQDGINDFLCRRYISQSPSHLTQSTNIEPLNSNKICFDRKDSTYNSFGCPNAPYWASATIPKVFSIGDTLNSNLDWRKTIFTLADSSNFFSCTSNFVGITGSDRFIGFQLIVATDTLFGWMKLNTIRPHVFEIEEIACESNDTTSPVLINGITDTNLACGAYLKYKVTASSVTCLSYQWSKNGIDIPGANSDSLVFNSMSLVDSGLYTCKIFNPFDTIITSSILSVFIPTTNNLSDTTRYCGDSFIFSVFSPSLSSNVNCLNFQWSKNGIDIPNANTSSLYFSALSLADSGLYTCKIISINDTITTSSQLSVHLPPLSPVPTFSITEHYPAWCEGYDVTYSVQPGAYNVIAYQWFHNGSEIAGATSNALILNDINASSEGNYFCRLSIEITNQCSTYVLNYFTNEEQLLVKLGNLEITQIGNKLISNYTSGNTWYFETEWWGMLWYSYEQEIIINQDAKYYLIVNKDGCFFELSGQYFTNFSVFPNPFDEEILVSLKSEQLYTSWELINDLGVVVLKGTLPSMQNSINTSTIAKGHYYLKINGQVMKMIKQ